MSQDQYDEGYRAGQEEVKEESSITEAVISSLGEAAEWLGPPDYHSGKEDGRQDAIDETRWW